MLVKNFKQQKRAVFKNKRKNKEIEIIRDGAVLVSGKHIIDGHSVEGVLD